MSWPAGCVWSANPQSAIRNQRETLGPFIVWKAWSWLIFGS
jgi:hypothetical protein